MPSPPAKQKSRFKSRILKILGLFKQITLTSSKYTRRYRNWSVKGHQWTFQWFLPKTPGPSNKTLTRPGTFTVSVYILPKTLCNWFYVTNFTNKSVLFIKWIFHSILCILPPQEAENKMNVIAYLLNDGWCCILATFGYKPAHKTAFTSFKFSAKCQTKNKYKEEEEKLKEKEKLKYLNCDWRQAP